MGKNKGRENPRSSSSGHNNSGIRSRPHVPGDVWWHIFIFLPASSLVRVRPVCKAWRTVIDDPIFVRAHIEKRQNNTILIHIRASSSSSAAPPPLAPYYSVDLDALVPRDGLQSIPATPARPLLDSMPVATCHGLMFEAFEIWNPLFADRVKLPRDFTLLPDPHDNKLVRGLGYDDVTDDYKAVVIDCGPHFRPQLPFRTFVYSLRSDSWRRIADCPCGHRGLVDRPGLFLNGALHWRSRYDDDDNDGDEIIALDLETEKYRKLQMPPFGEERRRGRQWGVLDGCLVVTYFYKDGNYCSYKFDAWVLERGSWVQQLGFGNCSYKFSFWHFSYEQVPYRMRPVSYIMNNKRHILMEYGGSFYLVDAERGKLKRVTFSGEIVYLGSQPFQETLFRPKDICGVVGGQQRKKMSSREKKSKIKRRMVEKYNTDFCFCVSDF